MYRNILLAYDGSRDGREALEQGAALASLCRANVLLLAVVNRKPVISVEGGSLVFDDTEGFETTLAAGLVCLRASGLQASSSLKFGDPAEQIAAAAREMDADLVVLGHRSQSALARWWNGSVGASVLKHAPCSVLIAVAPLCNSDVRGASRPGRKKERGVVVPFRVASSQSARGMNINRRPHEREPEFRT